MDEPPSVVRQLAHELRDALSPMRSAVDLLRLRNFDADSARRTAEKVDRGLDAALAAIDAFVTAEQCENGTLPLSVAECSLAQLIEAAREVAAPVLTARSQRLAYTPPAGAAAVRADSAKSRQVLTTLLEHASAAAPQLSQLEIEGHAGAAACEVRVRFPLDPAATPSEAWFENYRSRPRGSRLALRTARQIMVAQQGRLDLRLEADAAQLIASFAPGAAARVGAPDAAAAASAPAVPARVGGIRILLVEDSPEVRSLYREALVAFGYQVTETANAEEALRALNATRPDVVLIDIHLPGMNGYRLAQSLRARAGAGLRLVMLSGMTLDDTTVTLSRQAGFDDCIDKAAGPKALHRLLQAGKG
jgi:two-component system, sensor histidine kinase